MLNVKFKIWQQKVGRKKIEMLEIEEKGCRKKKSFSKKLLQSLVPH